MTRQSPVAVYKRVHRASPHIGILVLTLFEDDTSAFPAIRVGAKGYLLNNIEQDELLRAIHKTMLN